MVGYSELALRLPFLILGILCIPLAYKVASKWFNENVGLFVAAYFATSQYMIFHSVVIRPYIPGLFFSLCMLWYWSKLLFDSDYRWKNIFLMGLFGALCAYTHQFSMFFAFLLGLAGLIIVNKNILEIFNRLFTCRCSLYSSYFNINPTNTNRRRWRSRRMVGKTDSRIFYSIP